MEIKQVVERTAYSVKVIAEDNGHIAGRAYLYVLTNSGHEQPFGFIEDVFVEPDYRGQGIGTKLVEAIIAAAKEHNCYKIVGTSRYARTSVHEWYKEFGFEDYGKEFRMNLTKN